MTITQRDREAVMGEFIADKKAEIDYLFGDDNFKPSWNPDTNKAVNQPIQKKIHVEESNPSTAWLAEGDASIYCETCKAKATMKTGVSQKSGRPWRGIFCSADKAHVKWLKG